MNDLYANNPIAQAYAHLLSAYKFDLPMTEKINIMQSCVSLLKTAPASTKIKLLNNYGGCNFPAEELEHLKLHCKNHGIKLV